MIFTRITIKKLHNIITDRIYFLPRCVVEKELEENRLKELQANCSDTKITAIYSYHKNKWVSPAMSLFIQLIKESFEAE